MIRGPFPGPSIASPAPSLGTMTTTTEWDETARRWTIDVSEQRPWATTAKGRLAERLATDRKKIRGQITEREAKEALKKKAKGRSGW